MNLLTRFLSSPTVAAGWDAAAWNRFLPQARNARLLGRCLFLFEAHEMVDRVPGRILDQMHGALAQTRYVQGQARRELRQVWRVLDARGIRVMALKGVAYLHADLPPAAWRSLSDIDVMVGEGDIDTAEQALLQAGWMPSDEFDDYDQHYYRDWMHEVPPLVHADREIEVDLHHNLAPPVSRIHIDANMLWADAERIVDGHGLAVWVLSPVDRLLHNAVHLFMNDELRGGLRDVVDFRDLFDDARARDAQFEQRLLERSAALGCDRALYYAVTTARRLAGLSVSEQFGAAVAQMAPPRPVAALMTRLIEQVLAPSRLGMRRSAWADRLLFIRSHWVRMPWPMLLRHLWHKATRSAKSPRSIQDAPG